MKAKRQTEVVLNSGRVVDGFGGHIWTRPGLQDFAINSASEKRLRAYIRPRSEGRHPRALMEFALSP